MKQTRVSAWRVTFESSAGEQSMASRGGKGRLCRSLMGWAGQLNAKGGDWQG